MSVVGASQLAVTSHATLRQQRLDVQLRQLWFCPNPQTAL